MVANKQDIDQLLKTHKETILSHGVKQLGLFGSFVENKASELSDVDFLVEFESGKKSYDNFIKLAYFLEDILGRKVELITENSLSKHLKPHIQKQVEYVSFGI